MKKKKSLWAVSEILGTVLLLGISISLFGFLNFIVFSFSYEPSTPSASLIGGIDRESNAVVIDHYGGETLDGKTNIIVMVGSSSFQKNAQDVLDDSNGDMKWDFGESVHFTLPELIEDKYLRVSVVDPVTNSVVLSVLLQEGIT